VVAATRVHSLEYTSWLLVQLSLSLVQVYSSGSSRAVIGVWLFTRPFRYSVVVPLACTSLQRTVSPSAM
jgi:hypothetical protein